MGPEVRGVLEATRGDLRALQPEPHDLDVLDPGEADDAGMTGFQTVDHLPVAWVPRDEPWALADHPIARNPA